MNKVDVSIVIVNYNTKDITLDCIESVFKYTKNINFEIILVDNGSSDGIAKEIKNHPHKNKIVFVENDSNVGFAAANNQGIEKSAGDYVLCLNSDTLIHDNVIGEVHKWMIKNRHVAVSTIKMIGSDNKLQESAGFFPTLISVFSWMTIQDFPLVDSLIKPFHPLKKKTLLANEGFFDKSKEVDWVIGAFCFAKKDVMQKVGGWDTAYFMYTEDVDLCYRIKKEGYKVMYLADWQITHLGGASSGSSEFPLINEYKGIKLFYKKHYPAWQYPLLRLFLKVGALGRMVVLGILEGGKTARIYAKAFQIA